MVKPLPRQEALERIQAPSALPISLGEVRSQLRVEHYDDDALLARLINTAVAFTDVNGALGHAMISQKWAEWFGPNPNQTVRLELGPVIQVDAVKYYDEDGVLQTDTLANYEITGTAFNTVVGPSEGFNWPVTADRSDAIRIEYTIGYGTSASDVPETVRHALMLLVGHWYDNREQSGMDQLANIPFGFEELVAMHRRGWYG